MKAALKELQDRAEQLSLFSLQGVRAVDWGVLLRETEVPKAPTRDDGTIVLREADCPYRRARKIRSLVEIGAIERARGALEELPAANLERLPHDRDYLATLVHLAIASITTGSTAHAEALYALLSPYPHLHAADLSFHCDGSVSHFLGTLARSLGRGQKAEEHLEVALEQNERAGFAGRACHSAYELASIWAHSTRREQKARARALLTRVSDAASRMVMVPLVLRAEELLRLI